MKGRVERAKRRTWVWVLAILLAALGANGVAYLMLRRPSATEPTTPPAVAAPAPAGDGENEGLARARRAAGIAALERRDYDTAFAEFTAALKLRKDKGDLAELLSIAQDLRSREVAMASAQQTKPPPEPAPSPAPAPAPAPAKPAPKNSKSSRVASRAPPPEPPAPEVQRNGLLLVTSTPPGLMVMVDGKPADLTPARLSVRAGSHRVALLQGERRVFEDTVEVEGDAVQPINWEMKESASPPPSAAAPAQPPPSPPPSGPAAVVPAAAVQPPATQPSPATANPTVAARPPPEATGDLEISSPSLYGEIWVNGRPHGFPPVVVRGLPAGKARLEVRVQGAVKRRMTVEVEPGRSTPVRVR